MTLGTALSNALKLDTQFATGNTSASRFEASVQNTKRTTQNGGGAGTIS